MIDCLYPERPKPKSGVLAAFAIPTAPRTKKTHSRIITRDNRGQTLVRPRLLPSREYEAWTKRTRNYGYLAKEAVRKAGGEVPIRGEIEVTAHFYRETRTGDLCGFQQALGDWLQDVGLIVNDAQIASWDGTRRRLDRQQPRIEVVIRRYEE